MKSQKGQSLVETALILPILLLLVFGITDFGRIFHAYLTLDHAGREAARTAAIGSADSVIEAKIIDATSSLDEDNLGIVITPGGEANRTSGSEVNITLTYPIDFLTPVIGQIIEEFDLKDTTVMRVE
ncbi:TadE/TadG family type IV pilus assembly protein [Virgibacillus litoralis]|uniref:Flp pilus assembly protein TadG n=1 Tax=Virgibacillus litoralis TaxID=578221 RepID=A0ABS4HED2_9BACI|nr:TadE family protein [Virgibacillus litoralis]MBP1949285.1 Flp pilus assembly protein TadG [Virgibacillus litoralis]